MRWNPDLLGVVAPFVDRRRGALRRRVGGVDAALRQPTSARRPRAPGHGGGARRGVARRGARVAAVGSNRTGADSDTALRACPPTPVGPQQDHAAARRDSRFSCGQRRARVAARCAEVASYCGAPRRRAASAHAGADLQPPVLAFALATARARLVRDRPSRPSRARCELAA